MGQGVILSEPKQYWEMDYNELYEAWAAKYNFGAKGELSVSEAKEIHAKWRILGKEAKAGL